MLLAVHVCTCLRKKLAKYSFRPCNNTPSVSVVCLFSIILELVGESWPDCESVMMQSLPAGTNWLPGNSGWKGKSQGAREMEEGG